MFDIALYKLRCAGCQVVGAFTTPRAKTVANAAKVVYAVLVLELKVTKQQLARVSWLDGVSAYPADCTAVNGGQRHRIGG